MNTLTTLKPQQPTSTEWLVLQNKYCNTKAQSALIDVLIPVYGAPNDTLRCLYSVLNTQNHIPFNLIVIEDCGPDAQLRKRLKELSNIFNFEYLENSENKGFVLTCNRGFELHKDRDILLLNSDTEVFDNWLDRIIACANQNPKAGTITAMSNNATICSYPFFCEDYSYIYEIKDNELDQLFAKTNTKLSINAPTGVGFCMYIRRTCLNEIGYFNYELFGKGYGEENDLCVRAENAGWQNLIALDVFVRHYGSSSFSNEVRSERVVNATKTIQKTHPNYIPSVMKFISEKPTANYLLAIDMERLKKFIANKPVFLNITHNKGGGTEKHHLEMCEKLTREGFAVISLKPNNNGLPILYLEGKYPLPNIAIPQSDAPEFNHWIKDILNPSYAHIHHLIDFTNNFGLDLAKSLNQLQIPYYFTAHDYYSICPRITLMDDDLYCGEPPPSVCNQCIANMEEVKAYNGDILNWRTYHQEILHGAKKVFVPDEDVMWRLQRHFPAVKFVVRPHFDHWDIGQFEPPQNPPTKQIRIGILGAIGVHKGMNQLYAVAKECLTQNHDIRFIVIGYTGDDTAFEQLNNVEIIGKYNDDELMSKIHSANLSAIWFPAVWPETYSYTLSAALATGLPIIAYNFGAIGNRLKGYDDSILLDLNFMLDHSEITSKLSKLAIAGHSKPKSTDTNYPNLLIDYYQISVPTL